MSVWRDAPNLQAAREERGLTQQELARLAGVGFDWVEALEGGGTAPGAVVSSIEAYLLAEHHKQIRVFD